MCVPVEEGGGIRVKVAARGERIGGGVLWNW